jgi:hypothetical protein
MVRYIMRDSISKCNSAQTDVSASRHARSSEAAQQRTRESATGESRAIGGRRLSSGSLRLHRRIAPDNARALTGLATFQVVPL